MSELVRMHIKGMTCAHCEASVATALEAVGAREVKVDHRRAEAVFAAPAATDVTSYREAVSGAGYRAVSEELLSSEAQPVPVQRRPSGGEMGWIGGLALVALPVLCCGLPLLAIALIATGAGGWLFAHGSLLAVPALGLAVGLLVWRSARRRAQ